MRTIHKVAYEFETMYGLLDHDIDEYAAITCPTTLLRGTRTPRPAATLTGLLAESLPRARLVDISGAGHMSPFTHADHVRSAILDHLSTASSQAGAAA